MEPPLDGTSPALFHGARGALLNGGAWVRYGGREGIGGTRADVEGAGDEGEHDERAGGRWAVADAGGDGGAGGGDGDRLGAGVCVSGGGRGVAAGSGGAGGGGVVAAALAVAGAG